MNKNMNISIYIQKKEKLSRLVCDRLLKNDPRIMRKLRTLQSTQLACAEIQKECDRYRAILIRDIEQLLNTTTDEEIVILRNEVPTHVMEARLVESYLNNPNPSIGEGALHYLTAVTATEVYNATKCTNTRGRARRRLD